MLKNTIPMFALLIAVTMASSVFAQDRYSLTLSNDFISKLKEFGSLKSEVSESARGKIGVIELRFADTKDVTPVELDIDVNVEGSDAVIVLDDDIIAKIKGQPVRIPTTQNGFARVLLKYDSPAMMDQPSMVISDETIFVRLSDVKSIAGELEDIDSISMTCKFGDVTIPLDQIAGIQLHTDPKGSAVVVLNDGDSLTGIPTIPTLTLTTDWGTAEILPDSIKSITTTANSKFTRKNTDFGTRWMLKTGNSFAPGM